VRARTNCGECGSEPVTNGRPNSGPIALKTPRQDSSGGQTHGVGKCCVSVCFLCGSCGPLCWPLVRCRVARFPRPSVWVAPAAPCGPLSVPVPCDILCCRSPPLLRCSRTLCHWWRRGGTLSGRNSPGAASGVESVNMCVACPHEGRSVIGVSPVPTGLSPCGRATHRSHI